MIDELAERLAIPRTTIYGWVRDMEIPRKPMTGWPAIAQKRGTEAMQQRYRALREAAYMQGHAEFPVLAKQPTFREQWLLDLDPAAIKFQRKSNSGQLVGRKWRSKYGVLQIRTSDTYLRARLDAWMDRVRGEWP